MRVRDFQQQIVVALILISSIQAWSQSGTDPCASSNSPAYLQRNCLVLGTALQQMAVGEMNLRVAKADLSAKIEAARSTFWAAQESGRGLREANAQFADLLFEKDLYYLQVMNYMLGYKLELDYAHFQAADTLLGGGSIDGGIREYAFDAYVSWIQALEASASNQKILGFGNPVALQAAIPASSATYEVYRLRRDMYEFRQKNKRMGGDPKNYAYLVLLINEGAEFASQDLTEALSLYGEKAVARAEQLIYDARTSPDGELLPAIQVSGATLKFPAAVLVNSFWGEDPELFLRHVIRSMLVKGMPISKTFALEKEFVRIYGHDVVIDAARFVLQAPKGRMGGVVSGRSSGTSFVFEDPLSFAFQNYLAYHLTSAPIPKGSTGGSIVIKLATSQPTDGLTFVLRNVESGTTQVTFPSSLVQNFGGFQVLPGSFELWTEINGVKSPTTKLVVPSRNGRIIATLGLGGQFSVAQQ